MADDILQTLNPETGAAPAQRIKDAQSLNAVIKSLVTADEESAMARIDVQKMLDGAPPYDPAQIQQSGQEGRCNLNFGDGKARVKAEAAGYYDLTDSVPMLARIFTPVGDDTDRSVWSNIISEEFHRMLKGWKAFDPSFQLLVQKFTSHGLGFLYFRDDVDWRWSVAGLDDFKVPRQVDMVEDNLDIAVVFREITTGKLYNWMEKAPVDDTRWNRKEVEKAILMAHDPTQNPAAPGAWEKWQAMAKNNDMFASATAKNVVSLAHAWIREFSGKVSYYVTMRDGSNTDYLFKCENLMDCVDQCFTYFPYEIGSNGTLHSVRGLGHEVLAAVQVLNTLRCQTVDNAKLAGSLLLQPSSETSAEDMAILFYAGATYIPPNVKVQNGQLNNPSQSILPIIQEMSLTLRQNSGDVVSQKSDTSSDKTRLEIAAQLTKEAILPTANLSLFYQPWGRHLCEVWRRVRRKGVSEKDPGGKEILDMRKRCMDRGVPLEAILKAEEIQPMRAVGYGSPTNRLLAFDEFMQYYGSLDPVGQNNLLRDRFAQRVGYAQVDQYVPLIDKGARAPADQEIAELQNIAMTATGKPLTVRGNDNHIIHLQTHNPSLDEDLVTTESGGGSPQLLAIIQAKAQHCDEHIKLLKPDKLQRNIVAELTRQHNNLSERVQRAVEYAMRQEQKQQAEQQQAQASAQGQPTAKEQIMMQDAQVKRDNLIKDAELRRELRQRDHEQARVIKDAEAAMKLHQQTQDMVTRAVKGAPAK
jgi:hypothetical protein